MSKLSLAFLLVFLTGVAAAFIKSPVWAFYVYEFVYFMSPGNRWWSGHIPQLGYSFIVVIVMMMSFFIHKSRVEQIPKLGDVPTTKWMISLLVMMFIMFLFALDPYSHKVETINYLKMMIVMGFAFKMIDSPQKLDHALLVYLIGCAYIGIEADNMGRNAQGRVEGIGTVDAPDSNLISATIAPAVPLLIYFFWKERLMYKVLAVMLGALIVHGLVLINSRGAFLGVLGGGAYFIFQMLFSKSQAQYQRLTAIMVIVLGLVAVVFVTDDIFWERMSTLTESGDGEDDLPNGASRMDYWVATMEMMKVHPMGMGAGGFESLSSQYLDKGQLARGTSIRSVHSMWFQALGEAGWPGLFFFIALLWCCYKCTRRLRQHFLEINDAKSYFKIAALEGAVITYLICGTFINRFRGEVLYWFVVFISAAVWIYLRDKKQDAAKSN